MEETFDVFEYATYLAAKWRFLASAVGIAGVLSVGISLLQPKRYTATATLLIEPPASGDTRIATAVSPMYLESLKTYEKLATSDTLFLKGATQFGLQAESPTTPIEALKQRVLSVRKLRDTKVLEVSVTLHRPQAAQAFAHYLAEETVNLSSEENAAQDRDQMDRMAHQLGEAQNRLTKARTAWESSGADELVLELQRDNDSYLELLGKLRENMLQSETDLAGYEEQERMAKASETGGSREELLEIRQQVQAERVRGVKYAAQVRDLEAKVAGLRQKLGLMSARRDQAETELRLAQTGYESTLARSNDLHAGSGMHGERLRVIDPGIVPQRPSSPNVALNVIAAVSVALMGSLCWLAIGFVRMRRELVYRVPALARVC